MKPEGALTILMPIVDDILVKDNSQIKNKYFLRDDKRKEELRYAINYLRNNEYQAKSLENIAAELESQLGRRVEERLAMNIYNYKNPSDYRGFSNVMQTATEDGYLNFQPRKIAKLDAMKSSMYVYDPEFVEYLQKEARKNNPLFKDMEKIVMDKKNESKIKELFTEMRNKKYSLERIRTISPNKFVECCRVYLQNGPAYTSKPIEMYNEWCAANRMKK